MEKTRRQFLKGVGVAAIGVTAISELPVLQSLAFAKDAGKMEKSTVSGASRILLSCSGTGDVGELADRVVRKLHNEGTGKMLCLAAISAPIGKMVEATKNAQEVLVIDACPGSCASKNLANAGISVKSINLNVLGFAKGKSPASDANVEKACNQVKAMI